jgi:transcriptional regulator with XRE-family HTH domain
MYDDDAPIRPDGLTVRRLRHERGWSPRTLIDEVERCALAATGLRRSLTPNLLSAIEERDEAVPYATLCLVSDAFDCDPITLVRVDQRDDEEEDDDGGRRRA